MKDTLGASCEGVITKEKQNALKQDEMHTRISSANISLFSGDG